MWRDIRYHHCARETKKRGTDTSCLLPNFSNKSNAVGSLNAASQHTTQQHIELMTLNVTSIRHTPRIHWGYVCRRMYFKSGSESSFFEIWLQRNFGQNNATNVVNFTTVYNPSLTSALRILTHNKRRDINVMFTLVQAQVPAEAQKGQEWKAASWRGPFPPTVGLSGSTVSSLAECPEEVGFGAFWAFKNHQINTQFTCHSSAWQFLARMDWNGSTGQSLSKWTEPPP